jgi:hypothetical protein
MSRSPGERSVQKADALSGLSYGQPRQLSVSPAQDPRFGSLVLTALF